ncbi:MULTISPECIES: ribonuclease H-like domain-containing protein [unclassified Thioalkalivibrio]|uniref:ribonuclease H-like domain-containing protein n=1 Tax=unclassified Thioalkalivibrio TaxID=2621013 RepID=UPI00037190E9|nr:MULTISPECIES: ribonuclease H-like domain-containing protein [unclassified Thioalkalivibrio]
MGLHDRLNTLRRQAGSEPPAPGRTSADSHSAGTAQGTGNVLDEIRARLDRMGVAGTGRTRPRRAAVESSIPPEELAKRLDGELLAPQVILLDRVMPDRHAHGGHTLARAREPAMPFWHADRRVGFIDTETTGLAGGAGTVAFLVGLATIQDGRIRLRQWLMTAFAGEGALLEAVDGALNECDHLVSYNGKTFDLPLLRDRRRMQRRPDVPETAHTDFLHPVRSLFGHAWPDCRLRTVEERLLGLDRQDDLPGSEAPWAWKAYLASGRSEELERVVRHNTDDILSLALLGPALASVLVQPAAYGASVEGAARVQERLQGADTARRLLESHQDRLSPAGRLWLAREWRREGRYDQAVPVWEALGEQGVQEALEALAKYHEHQRRDWKRALQYAGQLASGPRATARIARLHARLEATAR